MTTIYDGTLTVPDPDLIESWDVDGYDNVTAYLLRDTDAEPPEGDGIGYVFRISYDHPRYDDVAISGDYGDTGAPALLEAIRAAWDRFRDWQLLERYLRMWHDAVSVDTLSRGDYTAVAVVPREHSSAWGMSPDTLESLAADALEQYRAWADGEVYGVRVVNTATGANDALWRVYDASPGLTYARTVADDLAGPVSRAGAEDEPAGGDPS